MMKKRWNALLSGLLILTSLIVVSNSGMTSATFYDAESSGSKTFKAWASRLWTQTTTADFNAGIGENVTVYDPGNVRLSSTTSGNVTDNFYNLNLVANMPQLAWVGNDIIQLAFTTSTNKTFVVRPEQDRTPLELSPHGATKNWDCVDESISDNDTSYVYTSTTGAYQTDMYKLATAPNGNYTRVTVYMNVKARSATPTCYARTAISEHNIYYGDPVALSENYTIYKTVYYYDPYTGLPWTQGNVSSLLVGVSLQAGTGNEARCTQVWVVADYGTSGFYPSGTLVSKNLLAGIGNTSIDSFTYNAPAIPTGTSLRAQFSTDNVTWYSSSGALGGWDALTQGTNTINLSGLHWSGPNFYYQIQFTTTDTAITPTLDYVTVNYSKATLSGRIASQVLNTGIPNATWDLLSWDKTLAAGTNITFEVRASSTPFPTNDTTIPWISVGGTSPVLRSAGLPSGQYKQWRATLTSSTPGNTPILQEVRVWYDP